MVYLGFIVNSCSLVNAFECSPLRGVAGTERNYSNAKKFIPEIILNYYFIKFYIILIMIISD